MSVPKRALLLKSFQRKAICLFLSKLYSVHCAVRGRMNGIKFCDSKNRIGPKEHEYHLFHVFQFRNSPKECALKDAVMRLAVLYNMKLLFLKYIEVRKYHFQRNYLFCGRFRLFHGCLFFQRESSFLLLQLFALPLKSKKEKRNIGKIVINRNKNSLNNRHNFLFARL